MSTVAARHDSSETYPHFVAKSPVLGADDVSATRRLLDQVCREYPDAQAIALLEAAPLIATELPAVWRKFVHEAKRAGKGAIVVRAGNVLHSIAAVTPSDWKDVKFPSPTHQAEVFLVLVASLLGEGFGWATQQNGRYVHDVLPMRGLENEQIGWSSTTPLTWHTEDAFHPHRADYLALLCLRNPSQVATTVCSVADLQLGAADRAVLWQPRYQIIPDDSHRPKYNTTDTENFQRIQRMFDDPEKVSVLFGQRADPFLRIDPDYMKPLDGDAEAAAALAAVSREIERNLYDLVLQPGELVLLDNFRLVHGRRAFVASFDGNDRWLKRINIKHDIRLAVGSMIPGTRLMT
jgi:Fe(II)/alpha-ketoglutarate-dependent arginine beta-hydroxylase